VTEQTALHQLREAYRGTGLEVRFFPDCLTSLRWQVGRNGDGEHFALMAYGSTPVKELSGGAIPLPKCRMIRHNSRRAAFYPLCSSRAH
jgi:hypothetical protein